MNRPYRIVVWLIAVALAGLLGCGDAPLVAPESGEAFLTEAAAGKWRPRALGPGETRRLLSLAPDQSVEGITFDRRGLVFVTNRHVDVAVKVNEILQVSPDGAIFRVALLPSVDPSDTGALGLTTDAAGAIYAAPVASDASVNGVYRVRRSDGSAQRLAGSWQIVPLASSAIPATISKSGRWSGRVPVVGLPAHAFASSDT